MPIMESASDAAAVQLEDGPVQIESLCMQCSENVMPCLTVFRDLCILGNHNNSKNFYSTFSRCGDYGI